MTDMFSRLAPYIQDYIYANKWTELRDIQTAACQVVFDTDDNLLCRPGPLRAKPRRRSCPS